ncbi:MAG TPA: multidrug efflux SMR transporter [Gammaproteobacteria bacterium]|jgi:small multidrug resistance pump|nr:multidrug efflux SMR transporter [Gammaproteobacteria bacterium]HKH19463.1 multidrug efflux SMR transporter [Gammaproteobacteria bacterium]
MQAWLLLAAAILLEVAGTTSMKFSEGFTRALPTGLIFVFYACSFAALTLALKKLDLSIAYAIWAGIGTVLITLIGFLYFGEQATLLKAACIALIVIGVVGLNYATNA